MRERRVLSYLCEVSIVKKTLEIEPIENKTLEIDKSKIKINGFSGNMGLDTFQ